MLKNNAATMMAAALMMNTTWLNTITVAPITVLLGLIQFPVMLLTAAMLVAYGAPREKYVSPKATSAVKKMNTTVTIIARFLPFHAAKHHKSTVVFGTTTSAEKFAALKTTKSAMKNVFPKEPFAALKEKKHAQMENVTQLLTTVVLIQSTTAQLKPGHT